MKYLRLGTTGLQVSSFGLGMMSFGDPAAQAWALPEERAEPIVRRAVEHGITFFDTADMYSNGASEVITGRLLERLFAHRDDYVLASKVFYPMGPGPNDRGLSRKHILSGIDRSLRRLGTDYLDLYQVHRFDPQTPVDETMTALDDIVRSGRARYIGASGMAAWQFAKMQAAASSLATTSFVSMQTRHNLVNREGEAELIPMCHAMGVGVIPYSPLAQGLLAGTRQRQGGEQTTRSANSDTIHRSADFDVVDAVREVATSRGLSCSQIALAWALTQNGPTIPVLGATKEAHLDDAIGSLDVKLDDSEIESLETPYLPRLAANYT